MTSSTGGSNRGRPERRPTRPAGSGGDSRGRSGGAAAGRGRSDSRDARGDSRGAPREGQRGTNPRSGGSASGSARGGGAGGTADRPYRERDDRGHGRADSRSERPRSDGRSGSSDRPRRDDRSATSGRPRRDAEERRDRDPRAGARPARDDRARDDRRSSGPRRDSAGRGSARPDRAGQSGRPARTTPDGQEFKTRQRATRNEAKVAEPVIPDGLDMTMLERSVRAELRTLSKVNAEVVAGHLVAAGLALDVDAPRALAHARAARGRASRIAAVREAVGVAAYHAGEWAEAITELRTARRISGDPRNLPLLADCERALGRPTQAARLLSDPDVGRLDPEARAELFIVVAGARRDMGQAEAALSVLARGGLDRERPRAGAVRLWYVYADTLSELGRVEDAAQWFAAAAALDVEGETDAAERAADLL